MKCKAIAIYGWKTKKASKTKSPVIMGSVLNIEQISHAKEQLKELFAHAEACDGEIKCSIDLEWVPYYGGADPTIEIRFMCNKCKREFANEFGLPYDAYTLATFVNKLLEEKQ